MAEGAAYRLSYVTESSFGVPSSTTFQLIHGHLNVSGALSRAPIQSEAIRSDRGVASMRFGSKKPSFRYPFELRYGAYEDFIASFNQAAWAVAASANTGLSATVVAGTTNTIAATGIETGISAGDWVKISGFTGGYTANNGFFKVTAVATGTLTLGQAKDSSGTSLLVACSAQSGISVQRMGYNATGSTKRYLAFEDAYTDISLYREWLGMLANTFSLNITPDQIITGEFGFMGKSLVGPASATYTTGLTALSSALPMTGSDLSGVVSVDGAPTAIVTAVSFNGNNSGEQLNGVFAQTPYRIATGRSNLTGQMSLYLLDYAWFTKYLTETRFALSLKLMDSGGTTGYAIEIPYCAITAEPTEQKTETNVVQNISFQAEPSSTYNLVNWKWYKLA